MEPANTTFAIQRYLKDLADLKGDSPTEPIVRQLLERATGRLHLLCANLLFRAYPRLTRPPMSLQSEEMLSAVTERLLKALRTIKPTTVRQFFALANQHMRWELNDLARRLDEQATLVSLEAEQVVAPESSGGELTPAARRMLEAIEGLPDDERETFDLVRIQGMTHTEAAGVIGVATKTIQRRLNRSLVILTEQLGDLSPHSTTDE
ncbi:MAG TPA: sigma-70 family RNA polymerase sigma factor [Phycisphaerae bacterium]|nr:sigma-70 family RNA polymerase sigma factor [Phycisphaerae bacterium]HRW55398.1 sigma-70 family RNA polymerase sigma factor [Phycisphaerae bacterium]